MTHFVWELQKEPDEIVMEQHALTIKLHEQNITVTVSCDDKALVRDVTRKIMALFNCREVIEQIDFSKYHEILDNQRFP